jgi:hypothetical protein
MVVLLCSWTEGDVVADCEPAEWGRGLVFLSRVEWAHAAWDGSGAPLQQTAPSLPANHLPPYLQHFCLSHRPPRLLISLWLLLTVVAHHHNVVRQGRRAVKWASTRCRAHCTCNLCPLDLTSLPLSCIPHVLCIFLQRKYINTVK